MEATLSKPAGSLKLYEYDIEFGVMNNYEHIPELQKALNDLYVRVNKPQKNLSAVIAEIKKYIAKYPHVLPFQNYLYIAYMQVEEHDKAKEINENILAAHPDYLIGIINRAAFYLMEGDYDKIPEILGQALEIGELQPERKKFHISEYMGFNRIVVFYACGIDNLELAKNRLDMIKKIAPELPEIKEMQKVIKEKELKNLFDKVFASFQKNTGSDYKADAGYLSLAQTNDAPVFNHPLIEHLYHSSLLIDTEKVLQILSLPRTTLLTDLEEIIYDSIRRFKHYKAEDGGEIERCFPTHAMVLLAELKAVESLPVLLEVLRQGDDYLDYWFGDLLNEDLWQIYYHVFDLSAYIEYLREPRHFTFAKNVIADVIFRKIIGGELSQQEAVATYQSLFEYFIVHRENSDILDPGFLGGVVADIINLKLTELLPTVKTCFEHEMIDELVCGGYESVEKDIYEAAYRIRNISQPADGFENLYAVLRRGLTAYEEDVFKEGSGEQDESDYNRDPKIASTVKNEPQPVYPISKKSTVGRNDPCPCGSGKKFKKCCMN